MAAAVGRAAEGREGGAKDAAARAGAARHADGSSRKTDAAAVTTDRAMRMG